MWKIILFSTIALAYLSYCILPSRIKKIKFRLSRHEDIRTIFLTFDDGPDPSYTPRLLKVLKKYDVKATFFCVASFAQQNEDIINTMKKDGHLIALHSYEHDNAYLMTPRMTDEDFTKSLTVMKDMNIPIKCYRPPWGNVNLQVSKNIKKYDLKMVLWHIMAEDWQKETTPKKIEAKLLKRIRGGDIICLHDGRGAPGAPLKTIAALDSCIPKLLKKGFKFETVDKYHEKEQHHK